MQEVVMKMIIEDNGKILMTFNILLVYLYKLKIKVNAIQFEVLYVIWMSYMY